MKTRLPLAVLLLAGVSLVAQEAPKEAKTSAAPAAPADPFVKEKEKKAGSGGNVPATHANVGVVVQYIDVKRERWQQWLAANDASLDATPLRKEVETWITAGDAKLAESSLVMGKSGQRAKVESARNLVYPREFRETAEAPPFPTATETRNAGTTTETDLVVEVDGGVDINFAPERVVYGGENPPREDAGVLEGDLRHPVFDVQKATTSCRLDPQSWALVGCEKSLEGPATHQTLIFTRPLVHRFEETAVTAEPGTQGMLTWTWLEVAHEAFNTSLMKTADPSSWVGAGLYEEAGKLGAKVVEERSHQFQSGQRGKNESIREILIPTEWDQTKEAIFATPKAFQTWNVGTSVEVDPAISSAGGMLDLNMAPHVTYFVGTDVFHRVLVEDLGPGIPAGEHERIFLPFHRLDDRPSEGVTGTGLGLAIARDLAVAMGGSLRLVPQDGPGAAFELRLPAAAAAKVIPFSDARAS